MAYTATTFEEALQRFQKDFAYHLYSVLVRSGWELPPQNKIKLMGTENGENRWGDGYFHINFKPLVPKSVSYIPISTVVTERKPAQAAERIYRNSSNDTVTSRLYTSDRTPVNADYPAQPICRA